jgi:hypothetical protein
VVIFLQQLDLAAVMAVMNFQFPGAQFDFVRQFVAAGYKQAS